MAEYFTIQNTFTRGELTPKLHARTDVDLYYKGAAKLRDVFVLPQGGLSRRPALQFIEDLSAIPGVDVTNIIAEKFDYSVSEQFLLIFTAYHIFIYLNDVQVADVATAFTADQLPDIRVDQEGNLMVIGHVDVPPQQLVLTASPNTWTLSNIVFKNLPTFDFDGNYSNIIFKADVPLGFLDVRLTDTSPPYTFDPKYIGGIFSGNGAVGRIASVKYTPDRYEVNVIAPSSFQINTFTNPVSVAVINGVNTYIGEPVWSAARGWPTNPVFHEGRLWFGGSKSRPQGVWGSNTGDIFNFNEGTGLDDEAINITIKTTEIDGIKYLVSADNLQIFTNSAIYVSAQSENQSLTPTNIAIRPQNYIGIGGAAPVVLDNQVFYVQRGGKIVRNFIYDFTRGSYNTSNISILSPQLINSPIDSAAFKYSNDDDANYMFIVNDDGTFAVYQSEINENVSAWTLCQSPNGKVLKVTSVGSDIYMIVQREINGDTVTYLEKLNYDLYTDSCLVQEHMSPTTVITGLDHLEGQTVRPRGKTNLNDNSFVFPATTVSFGQITLPVPVLQSEVGINFIPTVVPMPLSIPYGATRTSYTPKTIGRIYVDLYQSLGVYVDDTLIPDLQFGPNVLDQPQIPQTRVAQVSTINGWDADAQITITQKDPVPMTILGIGYEVQI